MSAATSSGFSRACRRAEAIGSCLATPAGLGSACTGFWDAQAPAPGAWTDSHAYPHLPAMGGIGPDGAVTAAPSVSHAAQVPFMQPTDPGAQSNLFVANLPKGWGEPHLLALFG